MRPFSTSQRDILQSSKYDVHLRVEVQSSSGAYRDIGGLGVGSWVEAARWDWSLDQPVPEMLVSLRRDHGPISSGQSLAPLDENSTLNTIPSSSGYSPVIDVGRGFRVYTAATTPGGNPTSSQYDPVFYGEVDDIDWAQSPIGVRGRSKIMGSLNDRWIESSGNIYGSDAGTPIQDVIQSLIDDHTDLGISLWTPTSPGFLISPQYIPDKQPVLRAIGTLAQMIGWDVREHWSSTDDDFRLKFYEPDRAPSTTDFVFGPDSYLDVKAMSISREDVRNSVSVLFGPTTNRQQLIAASTVSEDDYGRKWMEIQEASNSAIQSSGEANTLAQSALADLKDPPALHTIGLPYWWPAELQDYYGFSPNDIHYDTLQEWGVYGVSHDLSENKHRTDIRVRGKPAGQYSQWLVYTGGGGGESRNGIKVVDWSLRGIPTTEASQQDFVMDYDIEWEEDTKSFDVACTFKQATSSGLAQFTTTRYYGVNLPSGDKVYSGTLLDVSGGSMESSTDVEQVFSIKFDTDSGIVSDVFSQTGLLGDFDGLRFRPHTGTDLGGLSPLYAKGVRLPANVRSAPIVGIRAVSEDSTGGEKYPGYALAPGSANVSFTQSTEPSGNILLTVASTGAGDVTGVTEIALGGITVTSQTGPVPAVGLDIDTLTDDGIDMVALDRFAIHSDTGVGSRKIAPANMRLDRMDNSVSLFTTGGFITAGDGLIASGATVSAYYAANASNLIGAPSLLVGDSATTDRILVTEGGASAVVRQAELSQLPFAPPGNYTEDNVAETITGAWRFNATAGIEVTSGTGQMSLQQSGFHAASIVAANLEYVPGGGATDSPYDRLNWDYTETAGGSNNAGSALIMKGNGTETGLTLEWYTAPTSTGVGANPASFTKRFDVTAGTMIYGGLTVSFAGAITAGSYTADVIASAYLDADTAHLTTIQTFTGAKTFSAALTATSTLDVTGASRFNGNVGIGMDATEILDIVSASGDARIRLDAPASSDTEIKFYNAGVSQYTIGHDDATDKFVIGGVNVDAPLVTVSKAGALAVTGTLDVTGASTFEDKVTIAFDGNEMLLIKDTGGTGVAATPYIGFDDSAGTRQGLVGFSSAGTQHLYAVSDIGEIRLVAKTGVRIYHDLAQVLRTTATGVTALLDLTVVGDIYATGEFALNDAGPHVVGSSATEAQYQWVQTGAFTAAASGTTSGAFVLRTDLTLDALHVNDSFLFGAGNNYGSSITTPASVTVAGVHTMLLYEPNITVGAGGTLTNAATLKIGSAPTEATNNYALWVDSGATQLEGTLDVTGIGTFDSLLNANADIRITNAQPTIDMWENDADADEGHWKFAVAAGYFYLQARNDANNGGVNALTFSRTSGTIVNQLEVGSRLFVNSQDSIILRATAIGATALQWDHRLQSGGNYELRSVNAGSTVVTALSVAHATGDATFVGDVRSDSLHIGGSAYGAFGNRFTGDFTSNGVSTAAAHLSIGGTVIGAPLDTSWLTVFGSGAGNGGSVTTQSGTEDVIGAVSTLRLGAPTITNNLWDVTLGEVISTTSNGTVNTTLAHGWTGSTQKVYITGHSDANYNGWWTITVVDTDTFTLNGWTGTASGTGGNVYEAGRITRAATLYINDEPTAGKDTGIDEAWGIYTTQSARLGSVTSAGIVPVTDATYALGSATNRWNTIYGTTLDITGEFLAGDGSLTDPAYGFTDHAGSGMYYFDPDPDPATSLNFALDNGLELSLETNRWAFGGQWTDNTVTSLDTLQLRNTSAGMGILGRTAVSADFGITHAETDAAIASRILFQGSGNNVLIQGSAGATIATFSSTGLATELAGTLDVTGVSTLTGLMKVGNNIGGVNNAGAYSIWGGNDTLDGGYMQLYGSTNVSGWKVVIAGGPLEVKTAAQFNSTLDVTGLITATSGIDITGASQVLNHNTTDDRTKIRVWNSALYGLGMGNSYTFGGLSSYAMTFQMNGSANRGWWWGDNTHTNAQGVMALTNTGLLTVASGMRIGYGISDTTAPTANLLDISGSLDVTGNSTFSGNMHLNNAAGNEMLLLKDTGGAGVLADPYMRFEDSGGTSQGYIGFGSTFNQDMYLSADVGRIELYGKTGVFLRHDNTAVFSTISTTAVRSYVAHRFASGTRLLPSITFDAETDLGFYRVGAGNVIGAATTVFEIRSPGATDSPYLAFYQQDNREAYIQIVNGTNGELRLVSEETASAQMSFWCGNPATASHERFLMDATGATTGRFKFQSGQVYSQEGTEVTATGTQTLDWDSYNQVAITNVGVRTINIDDGSMQDGGHYCVVIDYVSGSTTDWTWTPTGTLRWQDGAEPVLSNATVGDRTVVTFIKTEGDTLGFWATATV